LKWKKGEARKSSIAAARLKAAAVPQKTGKEGKGNARHDRSGNRSAKFPGVERNFAAGSTDHVP
jgi:hypothetical protein